MRTSFNRKTRRERASWKTNGVYGRIIWKWILTKYIVWVWTGFIWLRIGSSGGLLWTRQWTFGFHKWRRIYWLAEQLFLLNNSVQWNLTYLGPYLGEVTCGRALSRQLRLTFSSVPSWLHRVVWPPVLSSILDRVPEMDENWTFGVYSGLYAKGGAPDRFILYSTFLNQNL
jgi:hypothetical protein